MADTIVRTFSLLVETDQKLEQLTKSTYRRNKGDVIDLAVSDLWEKVKAEEALKSQLQASDPVAS